MGEIYKGCNLIMQSGDGFEPENSGENGQVLMNSQGGYCWGDAPASGISNLPGSPVTICYKWTGSAEEFNCLGTYRCDTEYNVIG